MSATTRLSSSRRALPSRANWRACSADSSRSSMTSDLSGKRLSWAHSSDPIDPPRPSRAPACRPGTRRWRFEVDVDLASSREGRRCEIGRMCFTPTACAEELPHGRQHQHVQTAGLSPIREIADQIGVCAGNRHEQGVRLKRPGNLPQRPPSTPHRDALDAQVRLERVVVQTVRPEGSSGRDPAAWPRPHSFPRRPHRRPPHARPPQPHPACGGRAGAAPASGSSPYPEPRWVRTSPRRQRHGPGKSQIKHGREGGDEDNGDGDGLHFFEACPVATLPGRAPERTSHEDLGECDSRHEDAPAVDPNS